MGPLNPRSFMSSFLYGEIYLHYFFQLFLSPFYFSFSSFPSGISVSINFVVNLGITIYIVDIVRS